MKQNMAKYHTPLRNNDPKAKGVSHWNDDRPRQGYQLALLGITNKQMSEVMDISIDTFDLWMRQKPKFREAVLRGKTKADAQVAEALFKRAIGYTVIEDHISNHKGEITVTPVRKVILPDVTAAKTWLAIRQRGTWTETQKVETTQTNININKFDFAGLGTDELMLVKKLGLKQLAEKIHGEQN